MQIRDFLKNNEFSYFVYVFALIGIFVLCFISKGDVVFAINSLANPFFDSFFRVFTELGNGLVYFGIGCIMLIVSYKKGVQILFVGLLLLLCSFVFKQYVFPDFARPTAFFSLDMFSHIIPDFEYAKKFSFPSGHTMSIFGLTTLLSFQTSKSWYRFILFFIACAVGFSRMYLLQHFFIDVYAGALLGFCISLGGIYLVNSLVSISEKGLKDLF